jgi:hypothetical protein
LEITTVFSNFVIVKANDYKKVSVLSRKILPPVFGIATIGWIIGGTIWFDKQSSNYKTEVLTNTPTSKSFILAQGEMSPRNICFNSGSAIPIYYNEHILALHQTADFLVKNNQQSLLLTGLSDIREHDVNHQINLGFARAEAIKSTLTKFGAPNNSLEISSEEHPQLISNNQVCDAVKMTFVANIEGHFQALNLFFKPNKFRFIETAELQTYFNDLQFFLQHNPTARLKIAAFGSDTEGSKISDNRLRFLTTLLKNKRFNLEQFVFENKKENVNSAPVASVQNLTNQRLEIRILTP